MHALACKQGTKHLLCLEQHQDGITYWYILRQPDIIAINNYQDDYMSFLFHCHVGVWGLDPIPVPTCTHAYLRVRPLAHACMNGYLCARPGR